MAVTLQGSGTLTAAGSGVADTLLDVAVAGTYTLHVDTNAMVADDILELRIYQIILTGGTRRVVYAERWLDAQHADEKIKVSVPVSNDLTDSGSLRFELTQNGPNADKAFPWKVLKY